MQHFEIWCESKDRRIGPSLSLIACFINAFCCFTVQAQKCPPNIDFENGTFDGWVCYTGNVAAVGNENVISLDRNLVPVTNRHTMYKAGTGQTDPYGGFPVTCPNGSGYSVKLGNTTGGGEAEGISYEFTIPQNENSFSLVFNYAVVFQAPNHRVNEQPRMEIETTNVTDNSVISCASFTFIALGSSLSGFLVSPGYDSISVLYKNWSAVSVDLSGNAGKTIRLFFKTADCTFRRHFGYAYIDVNSDCSNSNLAGSIFCPDDTVVNVTAPSGYQRYTWYDSAFTKILGIDQTLTLSPPPVSGTTVAVKLDPYEGFGCPNTLFTPLKNTLIVNADAGKDALSCNLRPVPLGAIPKQGLLYNWSPSKGLSNPDIANPFALPDTTTSYIVTTNNNGGGCRTQDTVVVRASSIDSSIKLLGKAAFCIGYGDSAVLSVNPATSVQWFKDDMVINAFRKPVYKVTTSGTYYALLGNAEGCSIETARRAIVIDNAKPGIRYPSEYAIINLPLGLNARQIGDNILWKPRNNLNTDTSFTPTFKGVFEQLYLINIQTNSGCLTVDTLLVKTVKNVEIYVPNAFTPNKDGVNDLLRPVVRGVKEIRYFRVFSRWGQLLFEKANSQTGWDGTFKGMAQQMQAVVWMLECVGADGITYTQKGTSVLLR